MDALKDKIKGNWNQIKGKLRQEYAILNDNDLAYEVGQEEELLGKIQEKTGQTKEEIKKFIDNL
ncbi:MAG: general stress protein CsbD [Flavobacteriales bacterium]|nr:general stress protein CsbD [Flavobacteriales bacterium]|tara:strand:- start:45771 stop:45962 length:192 start_codon:yes stop_codon:yes gene_type:complete